ncbi:transposase [Bdellovibrio bacteriovorus W]|nr:transposase [Bdellovibrio bacteriovorus W]AHI05312.1 transposase [Bdellovibrio bacteriovorus W]AHI06178.1 transposase [Bdellovibrio bacteriovorus W]AHI06631.1 transposase [Bdellovibrio bacteriovorus W]AHI06882.1 transposase [Bdellovibrio bacteriovorus W]
MGSFTAKDRKDLENNQNVLKVTTSNVTYTPEFKVKALKLRQDGLMPSEIFKDAGINLSLFGKDYPRKCIQRWAKMSQKDGGLKKERRGVNSTGRPKGLRFKSAEEEIAYLRAENDFLKKLHALEARYANKKSSR